MPAATRTLKILQLLGKKTGPVRATTISRELNIPRSSVYHLLAVMQSEGFIAHFPEEQLFGLSDAAFDVSFSYLREPQLVRLAEPLIKKLAETVRHSVHLTVLQGRGVLCLLNEQSHDLRDDRWKPGTILPANLTPAGRAILAELSCDSAHGTSLNRVGQGMTTAPGPRRGLEMKEQHECGYVIENNNSVNGAVYVSSCVFDRSSAPIAALTVNLHRSAYLPEDWPRIGRTVRRAANELTLRLGGIPQTRK